jgi:hypothetical protein
MKLNNGKHGQGTLTTKMDADPTKNFSPICLPKPKSLGFLKKKISLVVVTTKGQEWGLWQYWLWSFQERNTKSRRFLAKNQQ